MRRRTRWLALLPLIAVTYGCASVPVQPSGLVTADRWRIHTVELMYGFEEGSERQTINAILLNAETGDTWIWWPTRDNQHGYSWLPVPKQTEPGKAPPDLPEF